MQLRLSQAPAGANIVDVLVIGAGGAGMAAALCAAIDGARVWVIEHTAYVGGTTALSGGTTWVPGTHHAQQVNPSDTLDAARLYLDTAIGDRAPRAMRESFLKHGAEAVAHIEANSSVRYRPYPHHPDYLSELPGSTVNGRALEPVPFDGRMLGTHFSLIRPPIPEFTVLGGMMVDRTDINHLLGMSQSWRSFKHATKILARHLSDRLRYPRGTRLVMGNALVGRLLHSLAQRPNVRVLTETRLTAMTQRAEGGWRVTLQGDGTTRELDIPGGIIFASGGFNRHPDLRSQLLPGVPETWCPAAPGHTGEAQSLARQSGAHMGRTGLSPAFWAPVSRRQRPDGSTAVFPHFMLDRAKPGFVTVNHAGHRFVNESTSYHLFGLAMQVPEHQAVPAFLIADADALTRYGMGMVRPGGKGLAPFLDDGYLISADSLDALANKLNIPAANLRATVDRINEYAIKGHDPDFHRGETAYQRNMGDASRGGPNPNLGAIQAGPYYAVRLYPGDIGAATGLATDERARIVDQQGHVIPGLYAVGNDMHSIMGGVYTGPGITLGPGLVFGYLAGRAAAAQAIATQQLQPQPAAA